MRESFGADASPFQRLTQIVHHSRFMARRVLRVQPHDSLKMLEDLAIDLVPVRRRLGKGDKGEQEKENEGHPASVALAKTELTVPRIDGDPGYAAKVGRMHPR